MEVLPLFSTPMYVNNIGYLDCNNLKEVAFMQNETSFISQSQEILNEHKFSSIKKKIDFQMETYVYDILKINKSLKLHHVCSWMVLHKKGNYSPLHLHSNSMFSGVLYLKCDENSGKIKFSIPQIIPTWTSSTLDPIYNLTEQNIFNSREWVYQPKKWDILCFPSHTYHEVEPSFSDSDRLVLSFNYILKGKFGRDTGYLNI